MSIKIFYTVMPALFLSSCTTVPVNIDYDDSVAFATLHNFSWAPNTPPKSNNPNIDSDTLLHDRIHNEVENWLWGHGYAKTEQNRADFLVTYRIMLEYHTDLSTYGGYYGYPFGWGWGYYGRPYWGLSYAYPMAYSYDYQVATITIDMLNPKTHKLIWRGSTGYEVEDTTSPLKKREKIAWAVNHILEKFPPGKQAQ
ncbi:MAG: DUF4136 domain-containing protein [Gammaproteobacteria bacterium]